MSSKGEATFTLFFPTERGFVAFAMPNCQKAASKPEKVEKN